MRSRAVIFVNGDLPNPAAVEHLLQNDDLIIAADGGLRHLRALGRLPHMLIGDLDSVNPGDLSALQTAGVRILKYPPAKDETDLELAMNAALESGADHILLVGALGGRLDQTLGNLFLLSDPRFAALDVRLEDGQVEAFLIRNQTDVTGEPGDTVSLLPLGAPAEGVTTDGLQYPLRDETLYPYRTRGISNVLCGSRARVSLRSGLLLCVHMRQIG
ncbi:MAG: thiamine diphosphokinase [Anaerolineaceae bacterium]